jgi:hypothetical protein
LVLRGAPKHVAVNFTGIVLLSLKALTGSPKLPPFRFSTAPPIGMRKPLNAVQAVSTVTVPLTYVML